MVNGCVLENYEDSNTRGDDSDDDSDSDEDEDDSDNSAASDTDREPLDLNEVIEALCYKACYAYSSPEPEGKRDLLAIEIKLRFTKGHKRNSK